MSRRLPLVAVALAGVVLQATPPPGTPPLAPRPAATPASDYRVAHWTTADGLPQNSVLDVLLLPNDEMWLATFGGLVSFDGVRFEVVDVAVDEALPSHRIVALEADGSDALWFLTQEGHLGRARAGRTESAISPPNLGEDAIGLAADGSGHLLAKLRDGTLWRTDGRAPWAAVPPPPSELVPHLSIAARRPGVAVAWRQQLLAWQSSALVDEAPLPRERMDLFNGPGNQLWLADGTSLWRYDAGRFDALTITPPFTTPVTAMAATSTGGVWVASLGELSRLEPGAGGRWHRVAIPIGLAPGMLVRQLAVDRQQSLWVGTDGQGLFRVNRPPARIMGPAGALKAAVALSPDGDGGAFVGESCLELHHVDRGGVKRRVDLGYRHDGRNDIGCTLALARAGDDAAFVRLGRRLLKVDRATLGVAMVTSSLQPDEGPIEAASDGTVWVTSRQGSVERLLPDGRLMRVATLEPPLVSAALAPDGSLWVGGHGTVAHITDARVETFGADVHVPRGPVRDILPDADGAVWIGTYGGGLGLLRDGHVSRLSSGHGLPDNSISRILADARGRLWISTNRGVAVVERDDLLAVADGREARFLPVVFGPERGVAEANFGSPAGFLADDGGVWLSTIEGAVRIDAAGFPGANAPPAVSFDRVSADERIVPLGPHVTIPALATRVRLDFTSPERLYPDALRFRYRVDGPSGAWVDVGSARSINWTPPSPGRHRILVEARSADGIWSAAPTAIVLDVQFAWWQRRSVQALAGLALVTAVTVTLRRRVRRLKAQHASQLHALEAQRRAEHEADRLRLRLELVSRTALAGELAASLAHEVRQPLGSIVNNAEAGRRNLTRYLARPAELDAVLRDIVADGMRASGVISGLRGLLQTDRPESAPVNLSELTREIAPVVRRELSDRHVVLDLDLADHLPPIDGFRVQLGQVVVNLILNACEALSVVTGERRVRVTTVARGSTVEFSVLDNGPGPAPSVEHRLFEPFVTTKPQGLGMGLSICRSIAEAHGGHLTADRPASGGFRMTMSLPAAPSDGKRS